MSGPVGPEGREVGHGLTDPVTELGAEEVRVQEGHHARPVEGVVGRRVRSEVTQHPVQGQEHRDLQQRGKAAGERAGAGVGVEFLDFRGHPLLVVAVLLADLLQLRCELPRAPAGPQLGERRPDQQQADGEGEKDDGQRPGGPAVGTEQDAEKGVPEREQGGNRVQEDVEQGVAP
jgi:hypothetical protein